jgi:hypothetical protein
MTQRPPTPPAPIRAVLALGVAALLAGCATPPEEIEPEFNPATPPLVEDELPPGHPDGPRPPPAPPIDPRDTVPGAVP